MRRFAVSLLAIGLLFSSGSIAYAQGQAEESNSSVGAARIEALRAQLQDRSSVAREQQREVVTVAQQLRIQANCEAIQTNIVAHQESERSVISSHTSALGMLVDGLRALSEKLPNDSAYVQSVGEDINFVTGKVDQIEADSSVYNGLLTRALAIGCESVDAQLLVDLMQDARAAQSVVVDELNEAKGYINDVIKPGLQEIKASVESAGVETGADDGE